MKKKHFLVVILPLWLIFGSIASSNIKLPIEGYKEQTKFEDVIPVSSSLTGKIILFDESHNPYWGNTIDNNLLNYSIDLQANGCIVQNMSTWDLSMIMDADVLVTSVPAITYTNEEFLVLHQFVANGGGLFIIGDALTIGAWDEIAERFNVTFTSGFIRDYDDYFGNTHWINFTKVSNFGNHPIMEGVSEIQSLYGNAFSNIPLDATPLIITDADPNSQWNTGSVSSGMPTLVAFEYQYGMGRVVVGADSNIFSDEDDSYNKGDNSVLARNIIDWLANSEIPEKIIVFDESHGTNAFNADLSVGVEPKTINVLFDETHTPWNKIDSDEDGIFGYDDDFSGFGDYARILEGASFQVTNMTSWSLSTINSNDVIVMVRPSTDYSGSEIRGIKDHILNGGSLFLIAEGGDYGTSACRKLMQEFGADLYDGDINDTDDYYTFEDRVKFNDSNIAEHPIMNGVNEVGYIVGGAFNSTPDGAISLLTTDNDLTAQWKTSSMPAGNPSAQNLPTVIAFEYGLGRVVISLDMSIWYNSTSGSFLSYGNNSLFGINIIRWLGEASYDYGKYYDAKLKLQEAGYGVKTMFDFDPEFFGDADAMIIVPSKNPYSVGELNSIVDYAENGNGLLTLTDHGSFGGESNSILQRFGLNAAGLDTAVDEILTDSNNYTSGPTYILFNQSNMAIHPILTGIERIHYYIGTGYNYVPSGADILIFMDNDISAEWQSGSSASSIPVMISLEQERGRIVSIGDASLWKLDLSNLTDWGLGMSKYIDSFDNSLLLINTIDWLTANRAPIVNIIAPISDEILNASYLIEWTAEDFDDDSFTSNLDYSLDNGGSWIPIISSLTNSSYNWSLSEIPNGNCTIRIITSDGIASGQDEVDVVIQIPSEPSEPSESILDTIMDFLMSYWQYLVMAGLVLVIITILIKKRK